jgi:hypothetical protein
MSSIGKKEKIQNLPTKLKNFSHAKIKSKEQFHKIIPANNFANPNSINF